ncbi:MAG: hypothetical protein JSU86_00480 [Phycisphaerales bacterium]|nr:MAG: hypothetical protein JSU86_00480 [Phycisphaerales bacterium]
MKRIANSNSLTYRRGAIAVMTAVSMVMVLVCASLAVDVGYICALTGEAQNTADAGSLAGASALQQGVYTSYLDRALDVIARNQKSQGFLSLKDQTIEVGRWDKTAGTFTAIDPINASKANAVRVVSVRNDVSLFFAAVMGKSTTDVAREAVAMVTPDCAGIWGFEEVTVPGNVVVDSYDSTEGAYAVGLAEENGDVCSNGDLNISGSIEIYGDALGDPVIVKGGAALITGDVDTLANPVDPPAVEFGDVETNNNNAVIGLTDKGNSPFSSGWNMSIQANDSLTLPPGRFFLDSVLFASGASLTITGPTEIYVKGNFNETGQGHLNTTGNPRDLAVFCTGTTVKITGGAEYYGSLLAPNALVTLAGSADFYGGLIAKSIKMAGTMKFHVDESLPTVHSLKPPPVLVR